MSLLMLLTGCASGVSGSGAESPHEISAPVASKSADTAAQQQAQEWLDAAVVPPGAVPTAKNPGPFLSYQGWPCRPVVELEGYWTLSDSTVTSTINWLRENPTADLVSTAGGPPMPEDPAIDAAAVGYIPSNGSQQGIVYSVVKKDAGVAIRAEVAALTESAVCPSMDPGATLGKPGQG